MQVLSVRIPGADTPGRFTLEDKVRSPRRCVDSSRVLRRGIRAVTRIILDVNASGRR